MGEISGFTAACMKMSSGMLSLVVWNKLTHFMGAIIRALIMEAVSTPGT
jgi:hypothetical protein